MHKLLSLKQVREKLIHETKKKKKGEKVKEKEMEGIPTMAPKIANS